MSALVERDTRRLATGRHELHVAFRRFPELAPGAGIQLDADTFSPHLAGFGETLRVVELELSARALDESAEFDVDLGSTVYAIELAARLEHEDDPRSRVPAFRTPRYPIEVEGQIVSAVGEAGDRAYTVYEDDATSQDRYRVVLPTWNVTIEVPFTPLFQPGHLYFPAYRDARVLVAVGLDRARLTEAMAGPARTAVTQGATQGGAELTSVASAARQQIAPIVQQLTAVIDQAQSTAEQGLTTGKIGLLAQLTTARQTVETAACTASTQIEQQLATLERQLTAQQQVQQSEASVAAIETRIPQRPLARR